MAEATRVNEKLTTERTNQKSIESNIQLTVEQEEIRKKLNSILGYLNSWFQTTSQIEPDLHPFEIVKGKKLSTVARGRKLCEFLSKYTVDDIKKFEKYADRPGAFSEVGFKELLSKQGVSKIPYLQECPPKDLNYKYIDNIFKRTSDTVYLQKFLSDKNSEDLKCVLNQKREDGSTILHDVANHYPEVARILLSAGADPNIQDDEGKTPLHYAAEYNCPESITALLDAGASVDDIRDKSGDTPLHCARGRESIKVLLDANTDPNSKNNDGQTPLHGVASTESETSAQVFLESGRTDPNAQDNRGNTLLHYIACESRHSSIIELLLQHGASYKLINQYGDTPLHRASQKNDQRNIEAFINVLGEKLDINIKNKDGATPLLIASKFGSSAIVKLLLSNRANILNEDEGGNTALHYAAQHEHTDNEETTRYSKHDPEYDNEVENNEKIIDILVGKSIDSCGNRMALLHS